MGGRERSGAIDPGSKVEEKLNTRKKEIGVNLMMLQLKHVCLMI
jgi:hypothetical protein